MFLCSFYPFPLKAYLHRLGQGASTGTGNLPIFRVSQVLPELILGSDNSWMMYPLHVQVHVHGPSAGVQNSCIPTPLLAARPVPYQSSLCRDGFIQGILKEPSTSFTKC